jgi:pyruvate kinase
VANAIYDGADAVMLSGETAAGQYPVEAIRMMSNIVIEAERRNTSRPMPYQATDDISTGVAAAAVSAADRLGAAAIIAFTESGLTARLISELRPRSRIVALTPHPAMLRRMALYWGVTGHVAPRLNSTDAMIQAVKRLCAKEDWAKKGQTVVIVAGTPLSQPGNTNLMTIRRL